MTATFKLKMPVPTEGQENRWLFKWAQVTKFKGKYLSRSLFYIPNGVKLHGSPKERAMMMQSLKAQGFKVGISDFLLAIPVAPFHGMWLEMKRRQDSVTSDEQHDFLRDMDVAGYYTAIAFGWDEARREIENYLRGAA